jgi:hypothetical protein
VASKLANMKEDQPTPLSYDYIFDYIFKKLCDTFDKYRDTLPPVEAVEQAIVALDDDPESLREATFTVMKTLKEHAEKSDLVKEIFDNITLDLFHGFKPNTFPRHEGKFYINSIAD